LPPRRSCAYIASLALKLVPVVMSSTAAFRVKVVILGDSAVGKTSLLKYFCEGKQPSPGMPTTIGVDFKLKTVERMVNGTMEKVQIQVWDTAGQEKFRTITPMMYKSTQGPNGKMNSMGIIVCYDLTNRATLDESVDFWVNQVREHAAENVVTCIVGNKKDLADGGARDVPTEEGEALAKKHNVNFFHETSAYTGEAVEDMFLKIVDEVLVRIIKAEEAADAEDARPSSAPITHESFKPADGPAKKPCAC